MKVKRALRVWQRHAKVYTKLYLSSLTLNFVEPILYLTAMGFGLGAYVSEMGGMPYINYIAPGMVAYSAMFAASGECTYGTFVRLTFQKTFDAILATPVGIEDLIGGEMLWAATKSMMYGAVIILAVAALGLIESPMIVLSLPVLFVAGIVFAEMALVFTSLAPGIDYFNYYFTLVLTPMFLFAGVFFPLEGMPAWVSVAAYMTPLYHLVNVCRDLSVGAWPWHDALWLVVASVVLWPVPFRMMRRRILSR